MNPDARTTLSALAVLFLNFAVSARLPGAETASITVLEYNYTRLSPAVLSQMETEAGRILERAGVAPGWVTCKRQDEAFACAHALRPSEFVLRIVDQANLSEVRAPDGTMGLSWPARGGKYSTVSVGAVEELAGERSISVSRLLGTVVAHELGHLLLGSTHSCNGIMRSRWDRAEFLAISRRSLLFTAPEGNLIRQRLRTIREQTATVQ